jgi:DNA-binding MarR family transcriptional regulator
MVEMLPIDKSIVALDIIYSVMGKHLEGNPSPVKTVLADVPHSPTGVRYHYKRLVDDGWLETEPCSHDSRIKYLRPTDKLVALYFGLLDELIPAELIDSLR